MPFDALAPDAPVVVPGLTELRELRDIVGRVDDGDYEQDSCYACACGHYSRANGLDHYRLWVGGPYGPLGRRFGLGEPEWRHLFFPAPTGPRNRAEFLSRLDGVIAAREG